MADSARNSDSILADRLTKFNRAANGADDPALVLPAGPCTFRELSLGRDAQSCGCNAFWLNDSSSQEQDIQNAQRSLSRRATCFCGHHACFHAYEKASSSSIGNNYLTAQTPLEFHGSAVFKTPTRNSQSRRGLDAQSSTSRQVPPNDPFGGHQYRGVQHVPQGPAELADLVPADHGYLAEMQDQDHGLGLFWRNSSSRAGTATNFRNGALHQDSQFRVPNSPLATTPLRNGNVLPSQPLLPPIQVPSLPDTIPDESAGSATEVATPSVSGTPALGFNVLNNNNNNTVRSPHGIDGFTQAMAAINREFVSQSDGKSNVSKSSKQAKTRPSKSKQYNNAATNADTDFPQTLAPQILAELASLKTMAFNTQNLGQSLSQFHQRLERLETASFTHVTDQELTDRLEIFDARLLEIAARVEELETFREVFNSESSSSENRYNKSRHNRQRSRSASKGFGSEPRPSPNASTGLNIIGGLLQRLETLEAAVSPSINHPWEIEVVLLPWNPDLSGIWFEGLEASQASLSLHEQTAAGSNAARSPYSGQMQGGSTVVTQEWSGAAANRLSPRACGPTEGTGGMVYSRLKSRGFVQRLVLDARDASSIYSAISAPFANLLEALNEPFNSASAVSQKARAPVGLQGDFVPLRKVHKSSRLRYLSAAELTTPSLWTADFLDSSVFMKAGGGEKRLFITQPAAYLQQPYPSTALPCFATWQAIRELPRFKLGTSPESSFVGEGDARERCWTFNHRLDPSSSAQSSFASTTKGSMHAASEPISPEYSMADPGPEGESSGKSASEEEVQPFSYPNMRTNAPPITPVTEISGSQVRRSTSLPVTQELVPVQIFNAPKRNAMSFNTADSASLNAAYDHKFKRRRQSRSSEEASLRRPIQNPTPRESREPPSPESNVMHEPPWTHEDIGLVIPRGTTPVPYATPFSNNNGLDWAMQYDDDNNNNGMSDNEEDMPNAHRNVYADEDPWHGVSDSEHEPQYSDEEEDDDHGAADHDESSSGSSGDENEDMADDDEYDDEDEDEEIV